MRVVVLGKGLMLANIVLGVKDAGADIVGVLRYEKTCNSGLKLLLNDFFNPAPEYTLIKNLKIPELNFKSANSDEFRQFLISHNVDLIIVGTWREKIKKETFNVPTIATVNVHPSLLPKYRGPNPYLQTILHGEKYSGVTIHLMDENYDTGAILKQTQVKIAPNDTSKELREKTVVLARRLVSEFIKDLDNSILMPIEQSEENSSYFPNISGEERMLDFETQTSVEISRTIRALHPFLPCYITYKDKFFIVNPYKFKVLPDEVDTAAGEIIYKNAKMTELTIVCKDKRAVHFTDLKLYKYMYTKRYIGNKINLD